MFPCQFSESLFCHSQHPARATGTVVDQIGAGLDLVSNGQKDQISHEPDNITRREIVSSLHVVLLAEAANQLFKDRTHSVVVKSGQSLITTRIINRIRTQVDCRV